MDKEIKKKWVEALRSGKYEQGRMHLRTVKNKFCCLGVLCDIHDNTQWKSFEKTNSAHSSYPYTYSGYTGVLSYDLLKKFKLKNDQHNKLIDMNDDGKTFAEIADYIEENL